MRTRALRAIALLLAIALVSGALASLDALRLRPVPAHPLTMPWSPR